MHALLRDDRGPVHHLLRLGHLLFRHTHSLIVDVDVPALVLEPLDFVSQRLCVLGNFYLHDLHSFCQPLDLTLSLLILRFELKEATFQLTRERLVLDAVPGDSGRQGILEQLVLRSDLLLKQFDPRFQLLLHVLVLDC